MKSPNKYLRVGSLLCSFVSAFTSYFRAWSKDEQVKSYEVNFIFSPLKMMFRAGGQPEAMGQEEG